MNVEKVMDWNTIRRMARVPEWLQDGKFGIYTHWGIYSVPACRPNATWYGQNMYRPGTPQYEYHRKVYGGAEKFGYKDFIPMFTAEKFDPEAWAELFRDAGAVFAGPVAVHHDGFCMWDSAVTEWNSKKMGPHRDVAGELERAIRGAGMKYFLAMHHMENHFFFPHWDKRYDTADPRYSGLYGRLHDTGRGDEGDALWDFSNQEKPNRADLEKWFALTKEVIDRFSPDALWFDFGLKQVEEHYKRRMFSYFYEEAEKKGQDVVLMYKFFDSVAGSGLIDLELGGQDELMLHNWITDTTVDDGEGWGYLFDAKYKAPATLIQYLVDNVSKNGFLLLNVGPRPDGTIPEEAQEILRRMGKWLRINGEAIYGTTPWLVYGEGPTRMKKGGSFNEQAYPFTPEDIRYTAKGDTIYASCLGWTDGEYVLRSLSGLYPAEIAAVSMLGAEGYLPWHMEKDGLHVKSTGTKPCEAVYVLKIERKSPFAG